MKELPINQIICGDALTALKSFSRNSIDMCMTSPPYWGLRDYGNEQIFGGDKDCEHEWVEEEVPMNFGGQPGVGAKRQAPSYKNGWGKRGHCLKCQAWKGQLGLEPTPELYIEHMTEIFNEVKRVLKKSGTLWLNIGDTYWSDTLSRKDPVESMWGNRPASDLSQGRNNIPQVNRSGGLGKRPDGLSPKCLCMIPERLAWSLIQNGWILRNKIIWYKPNAMPSSVQDRFSNRWEYIFMFSKSKKYYFDLDAVREPCLCPEIQGLPGHLDREKNGIDLYRSCPSGGRNLHPLGKNPGDVINIKGLSIPGQTPQGISRKRHSGYFGSNGELLVNPKGKNPGDFFEINTQPFPEAHFAVFPEKLCIKPIKAGCPEDGVVLDPFCGAGTALLVAKEMRCRYIGIDVKQEYCDMCEKRLAQGVL